MKIVMKYTSQCFHTVYKIKLTKGNVILQIPRRKDQG